VENNDTHVATSSPIPAPKAEVEKSDGISNAAKLDYKKPLLKRLKSFAWMATAFYVWIRLVVIFFGGKALVASSNAFLISQFIKDLNWLGFVPVNALNLGVVLRVGWVLIITGFSPWQFVGLLIYVYSFPVWYGFYRAFRAEVAQVQTPSVHQRSGLRPAQNRLPLVALSGSGLLGWYVLFGGTTVHRTIWVAAALSGALMVALAYRAFQRSKPASYADAAFLISMEKLASAAISNTVKQWENEKLKKRQDVLATIKIYRLYIAVLLRQAAFIRGNNGRNRIYALLVLQYTVSLLLLMASAVLFWAFCIKVTSTTELQFSKCLLFAVSHFLPNVTPPVMLSAELPWWVVLGPGITAWILAAIYVGASTLLPGKQVVYAQRAHVTYSHLRKGVAAIRKYLVRLNSLP
jgi:Ca2+/Na+ antiporter